MKSLAEFLERPAGECAIGFALVILGSAMYQVKIPKAEDAIVAGLTLVARALVGARQTGAKSFGEKNN